MAKDPKDLKRLSLMNPGVFSCEPYPQEIKFWVCEKCGKAIPATGENATEMPKSWQKKEGYVEIIGPGFYIVCGDCTTHDSVLDAIEQERARGNTNRKP